MTHSLSVYASLCCCFIWQPQLLPVLLMNIICCEQVGSVSSDIFFPNILCCLFCLQWMFKWRKLPSIVPGRKKNAIYTYGAGARSSPFPRGSSRRGGSSTDTAQSNHNGEECLLLSSCWRPPAAHAVKPAMLICILLFPRRLPPVHVRNRFESSRVSQCCVCKLLISLSRLLFWFASLIASVRSWYGRITTAQFNFTKEIRAVTAQRKAHACTRGFHMWSVMGDLRVIVQL